MDLEVTDFAIEKLREALKESDKPKHTIRIMPSTLG